MKPERRVISKYDSLVNGKKYIYIMAKFKTPEMSWFVQDLNQEWRRFYGQAMCIFEGPLHDKEDSVKVSYVKLWLGDKGLHVFEGFTFSQTADAKKLDIVLKKFEDYCTPRKNYIMAALRPQDSGKRLWL